jgi:RNA polymerase sigma-70 factor (ECF subfamily)
MAEDRGRANEATPDESAATCGLSLDLVQLVTDHHAALYRYAFRLTGSAADAEDLTQEAFLIAQQKLGQIREAGNARSWLYTVLRNCFLRSASRRAPAASTDLGTEFDLDSIPEITDDQDVDRERLQQAINELADEFKVVLLMFYFEEKSYREIADALDVPPGTVMSRLSRAKSHLRKLFEEDDGTKKNRSADVGSAGSHATL